MFLRFFLLLFLSTYYLFASVILTDTINRKTDFTLTYFYDKSSTLSIDEINHKDFTQKIPSQFTLGYKKGNIWFKLTVENQSKNTDFVLYFTEPFWETFNLYEATASQSWKEHRNGLQTPLKNRDLHAVNPAFTLHIPRGESKTYYIKGGTISGQLGAFEIFTQAEYFRPSRVSITTFYQFYSGVLFIIVILNLFLLVQMRERINIYYMGYVLSYIIFISMFSSSYLYLGMSPWNEGLHTVGSIVLIFMALFSGAFLEINKYFPKKQKLFNGYILSFIILGILMSLDLPYVTQAFSLLAFTFMILLLFLAVKTWQAGKIKTHYYLSSLIVYMPTMGLMALTFNAFIPNTDFTRYAFLIGGMVEIIFFSLILASKFHVAKYDQIRLQSELLIQKEKNELKLQQELDKQYHLLAERNAMMMQQSRHAQMGEMIAMIAHQWRQPLASISAVVSSMEMSIALDNHNELTSQQGLAKIADYTQHLSQTIDDFREFFKEDKVAADTTLQKICESSLSIMHPTLMAHHINISTDYQSTHTIFSTYPHELNQVLLNLLKNAQEIFLERKTENPKIDIRTYEKDNKFYIEIEDNAGGISQSIIDKVFDPYFTTKGNLNGAGLGLYMSKKIILEHCHGSIEVKNKAYGALFTIQI